MTSFCGSDNDEDIDMIARKALTRASDALHKIATGIDSRKIRGERWQRLTKPMQDRVIETELTDEQIREVALDAFEEMVIALQKLGDPTVTIIECSPTVADE